MSISVAVRDLDAVAPSAPQAGDHLHLSPIDLKHLRRYTMGDPNLEREILDLFMVQLPKTIAMLADATNAKEWKIAAHTLKGSGRAVGAWRIARIAEQAEHSDGLANPQYVKEAVELLHAAAEEARSFIAATYG